MGIQACIHGHFYQPPREDPWLGRIFSEASAAPDRHWNERITKECYAPLAWSRRLDDRGRILEIVNCYEWISFNVGPTLMQWFDREAPEVLERIKQADRRSIERCGHGNAMAQIYHHVIMPLASPLDKKVETRWALDDFQARFGRQAEGMWLSECAVDTPTLEVLAEQGLKFVTLSPYQAKAVAAPGGDFKPVDADSLDISRPYQIFLPSGRSIAVFFYHGSLAQSVAFEGLLSDGEKFWRRLADSARRSCPNGGLMSMATDGETYGHHFKFGEMALAYVLSQGLSEREGIKFTNFAAYLAENPAEWRAELHEPSSWSCAHGVERWRSDCGCSTGGHPGWNQKWRAPLREAMNMLKERLDEHFFSLGREVFTDAESALLDFGQVLADQSRAEAFTRRHITVGREKDAWRLLRMQERILSAFASCAWFFDDIARIEPVKALTFALRAMELCTLSGGPELLREMEKILENARSNKPEEGSGKRIFEKRALPARQDYASLCLFGYLDAYCDGLLKNTGECPAAEGDVVMTYPAIKVELSGFCRDEHGKVHGKAIISHSESRVGDSCSWSGFLPFDGHGSRALLGVSSLTAHCADHIGGVVTRASGELVRHLQDYLNIRILRRTAADGRLERGLSLAHCVSNLGRLEDAQETQHAEDLWFEMLPYLPLACFFQIEARTGQQAGSVDPVDIAAGIIRRANPPYSLKTRCMELLENVMLEILRQHAMKDAELAAAVRRANRALPDMNWWKAQNYLWDLEMVDAEYRETATAVYFGR